MTKSKIETKVINNHVTKTNTKLRGMNKANKSLFETVRAAVIELGEDKNALSKYKANVECDRSSVNKIIKIANSEFVMENLDSLPSGWAVLHTIAINAEKTDIVKLEKAIESGALNQKTTLKAARVFFTSMNNPDEQPVAIGSLKLNKPSIFSTSQKSISYRASDFSQSELAEIMAIADELTKFGFEINVLDAIAEAA